MVALGALLSLLVPNIPPDEHGELPDVLAGEPVEREPREPDEPALA